jgi:hypothetical protein
MPYMIQKNDEGEFCVYKAEGGQPSGETLGCHPTEEEAQKQIAAIWANETAKIMDKPIPREVVAKFCPNLAERLEGDAVTPRDMPPQLLEGLCAAVPGDSFTQCMSFDFGDFDPGEKEAYCAWLHHECTGQWPGEKAAPATETRERGVRYLLANVRQKGGKPGDPIRFTASTEAVGRDGLVIEASAWLLDNYRKNPVVLWAHDYTGQRLPIGRANVFAEGRTLVSDIWFDQGDPFAREVERKYREGFLHAVSVGWDTLEQEGNRVTKAELLDISAVPVPGDPGALIQRQVRALKRLTEELESVTQSGSAAQAETRGGLGQRYGAVLSARNKEKLEQAVALIQEVLRSAEKPEEERGTEEALARILEQLKAIQGESNKKR